MRAAAWRRKDEARRAREGGRRMPARASLNSDLDAKWLPKNKKGEGGPLSPSLQERLERTHAWWLFAEPFPKQTECW